MHERAQAACKECYAAIEGGGFGCLRAILKIDKKLKNRANHPGGHVNARPARTCR